MDNINRFGCGAIIMWFLIIIAFGIGWIKCIVKEINCDFKAPYKAEIVYGIGIIVPVAGGVIGWLDIQDEPDPTTIKK